MLLYLLITGLSFLLFLKPPSLKPLPSWASDMRLVLLPPVSWKELLLFPYLGFKRNSLSKGCHFLTRFFRFPWRKMSIKRRIPFALVSDMEAPRSEAPGMSILDLPDLALECILEKLPPAELCCMAGVNASLRERCISDHFWERHMKDKWGKVIGPTAYREWQWHMASRKDMGRSKEGKRRGLFGLLAMLWPSFWVNKPKADRHGSDRQKISLPDDSIMSWYLALETGKFWFPAQVYNRENGHVGFMLSCYDAELSYDPRADTFQARYPPHGRRAIAVEHNVPWERLRAPPIDSPPHDLHISDCLGDLKPGNHIEIQWRRNKEFPYGWWYGVVGHLESCDGNESYCLCHNSDTVILEFHQYTPGSRWRCTAVNRKDHREEGNEADGFYGGIRKLYANDEISMWKRLWPADVLE